MSPAEHAARLCDGGAALIRSYVQWLASDGAGRALVRALGGLLAAIFFILMVQGTRWLMWVALVVAVVASYATGGVTEQDDEDDEPAEDDEPVDVLAEVWDAVGDDRGALLTVLRDRFSLSTTKEVRALLAEAEIEVREGVRTAHGNGPGVHRNDLPALASPLEEEPETAVGAGEDANTNANNTTLTVAEIGLGGRSVRTDAETSRRYSV